MVIHTCNQGPGCSEFRPIESPLEALICFRCIADDWPSVHLWWWNRPLPWDDNIVFSHANNLHSSSKPYGWAPRGQRPCAIVPNKCGHNLSIVLATLCIMFIFYCTFWNHQRFHGDPWGSKFRVSLPELGCWTFSWLICDFLTWWQRPQKLSNMAWYPRCVHIMQMSIPEGGQTLLYDIQERPITGTHFANFITHTPFYPT